MSDPVTNVEIEDVLSSIRRLVSDGDKARTRDPAPEPAEAQPAPSVEEPSVSEPAEAGSEKPEKLVLTPALMIVGAEQANEESTADADETWFEPEADAEVFDDVEAPDQSEAEPDMTHAEEGTPSDLVFEEEPTASQMDEDASGDDAPVTGSEQASDRSELVATIAELEAAFGETSEDYEPDGGDTMGQTIAWPGSSRQPSDEIEDAEPVQETEATSNVDPQLNAEEPSAQADTSAATEAAADDVDDEYGDDDLDGLLDAGGVALDEAALRALVGEIVREELTGPMGERITRNVRKLVRREIYRILSSQEFD